MNTAQRPASGKDVFIDGSQRAIQLVFSKDRDVTAHFSQGRQRMLQQGKPVQSEPSLVLAHTCALAACKHKTGELGVDHRDNFSARSVQKKQGLEARKENTAGSLRPPSPCWCAFVSTEAIAR